MLAIFLRVLQNGTFCNTLFYSYDSSSSEPSVETVATCQGMHLPLAWQGGFDRLDDAAAAGHLHAHHRHALDVVVL